MQTSVDTSLFTCDPNFYYLTGIASAGWLFINDGTHTTLVKPKDNEHIELWNGAADIQSTVREFDQIVSHDEGWKIIEGLAKTHETVFSTNYKTSYNHDDIVVNSSSEQIWSRLESLFTNVVDARDELKKLRAIKSDTEIEKMRQSINVTVEAFKQAKGSIGKVRYEYELEAEFSYFFRRNNAHHAYEPIVAGGKNSLALHYIDNTQPLPENGLVLIDIGARSNGYNADITRTYAVGMPTEREVAVHAAVENAHHKIIGLIKPGVSFEEYQKSSDEIMKQALKDLGLLESFNDKETYRKYFPHAVSHGLGLDVHESLGGNKEFKAGMILTVEPGIYILEEGIGVRIEDDILVTEAGNENLSADLPTAL